VGGGFPEPVFLNVYGAKESISRNRFQGIDSKELIPPAYVAWRAGTINLFFTRFLAPIDCLKIPAQGSHTTHRLTSGRRGDALVRGWGEGAWSPED